MQMGRTQEQATSTWPQVKDERTESPSEAARVAERYRLAAEAAGFGVYDIDLVTNVVTCSDQLKRLLGVPTDGHPDQRALLAHVHPDDRLHVFAEAWYAPEYADSQGRVREFRVVHDDGEIRWLLDTTRTIYRDDGTGRRAVRVIGALRDITQRKQASERLSQAAAFDAYRARLLDQIGGLTTAEQVLSAATRVLGEHLQVERAYYAEFDANHEFVIIPGNYFSVPNQPSIAGRFRMHGYSVALFDDVRAGRPVVVDDVQSHDRMSPEERERYVHGKARAFISFPLMTNGRLVAVVEATQSTSRNWTAVDLAVVRETAERIASALEHTRADAKLRASEERFRLAARTTGFGLYDYDITTNALYCTPELRTLCGIAPDAELSFETLGALTYAEDRDRLSEAIRVALDPTGTGEFDDEYRIVRPDNGAVRWLHLRGRTLFGERGATRTPMRIIGVVLDISERREVEEQLREREATFRAMFSISSIGKAQVELPSGRFIRVNAAMCAMMGYQESELLQLDARSIAHPDEKTKVRDALALLAKGIGDSYGVERRYVRKDGTVIWVHVTVNVIHEDSGPPRRATAVIQDITSRKNVENALRESEERFRLLADNIAPLAWMADGHGRTFWYNKRWYEYTGISIDDTPAWGWPDQTHPDHLARVASRIQKSWSTGDPWDDTFPLRGRDGTYRWFLSRALPIRDATNNIVRWFGTNTDVTDQRALADALREADRRKDDYLAMLGHELRNPLAPIRNAVQILRMSATEPRTIGPLCDLLERQVMHMVRLVDDLLDVARVSRGKIELQRAAIDLRGVIHQAVESTRPQVDERGHQLLVTVPESEITVMGDFTRLTQVVSNLLDNAAKYSGQAKRIWLSLSPSEARGDEAVIRVRDEGRGIDRSTVDGVFDLFYQAEPNLDRSEGGLGIGLSLVKSLTEMHGGTVAVQSAGLGLGSEFVVRLPSLSQLQPSEVTTASAPLGRDRQRVLVVDDNRDSAESTALLLQLMGHDVLTAHDGVAAVRLATQERPTVVLLDIGLPMLDGYDACRAMRREGLTDTFIVAVTGYGQADDRRRSEAAGFNAHLVKPVSMDDLAAILARLDGDAAQL
ncbi:MAG: PAS domain-containing protein [Gemmatimonadaceae bacterium]